MRRKASHPNEDQWNSTAAAAIHKLSGSSLVWEATKFSEPTRPKTLLTLTRFSTMVTKVSPPRRLNLRQYRYAKKLKVARKDIHRIQIYFILEA